MMAKKFEFVFMQNRISGGTFYFSNLKNCQISCDTFVLF